VGSKITTAVDTFSFGIMMWELYTGQRAYSGLGRDAIIDRCAAVQHNQQAQSMHNLTQRQQWQAVSGSGWLCVACRLMFGVM
jgi:hypothetical protein